VQALAERIGSAPQVDADVIDEQGIVRNLDQMELRR
jgi:hypothetical protein